MTSRFVSLAALSVAVAGALAAPKELGVLLLAAPVLAILIGPRLKLSVSAQLAATFVAAILGILAVRLLLPTPYKHDVRLLSERELLFLLPLSLVASLRAMMAKPRFGARLTMALALLALTAAGGALSGLSFPILASIFCLLACWALAVEDPHRRRKLPFTFEVLAATLLSAVLVIALTTGASWGLPRLHSAMMNELRDRMRSSRVGFSSNLELGDMGSLLEDSRVVLRVRGDRVPELLRGVVFTRYDQGRWLSSGRATLEPVSPIAGGPMSRTKVAPGLVEIEHARRPERYFLPADATAVTPSAGGYSRDEFGIAYPPEDEYAKRVWFRRETTRRVQAPEPGDLQVPVALQKEFSLVLRDWKAERGPAAQRLNQLQKHLRSFRYTLHSERHTNEDPIIDFLRHNPEGHCEYFATAMALLARSAGVPTRLVSGYRVAETSPFGYHIVRRLHAHSWTEAWLDNRWVTFDPTPAVELLASNASETSLLAALVDGARTTWAATDDWLEERTTFEIALTLLLLSALLVGLRARRNWQHRGAEPRTGEKPLESFRALDERLAKRGVPRGSTETVHHFALRIEQSPQLSEEQRALVAKALRDYAVLRYAGRGDQTALEHSLRALARAL